MYKNCRVSDGCKKKIVEQTKSKIHRVLSIRSLYLSGSCDILQTIDQQQTKKEKNQKLRKRFQHHLVSYRIMDVCRGITRSKTTNKINFLSFFPLHRECTVSFRVFSFFLVHRSIMYGGYDSVTLTNYLANLLKFLEDHLIKI